MPPQHGKWTFQEQNAFEASKELLAAPRVLAHYDPQLTLVLACDASPYGLGAVSTGMVECATLWEDVLVIWIC